MGPPNPFNLFDIHLDRWTSGILAPCQDGGCLRDSPLDEFNRASIHHLVRTRVQLLRPYRVGMDGGTLAAEPLC